MTPAQRDLRDFIVDYQNANGGVTPSYQEMADGIGLSAKSGVHRLLMALERDGLIERDYGAVRNIRVTVRNLDLSFVPTDDLLAELHSRNALARAA